MRRLSGTERATDPVALAMRIERAEAEQLARTGVPGSAGALAVAGGLAVWKGPRSPWSSAFGLGLCGPVSAEDVDRVEAHLGALGGEVRVEVCACADASLAAELARRRYRLERFLLVLARAVEPARPAPPARAGRLAVRALRPGEERAFVDVFATAHAGTPPASGDAPDDLLAIPRTEGNACFAAFDGVAPVAVAVVSEHERVAELSGAGVLPAWRGRGLQLALVQARLAWAAARRCDLAASAIEPGGASQRTLERAGFRVAYPKAVMLRGG